MLRLVPAMLLALVLSTSAFAAAPAADAHEGDGKVSPIPTLPQAIAPAITTLVVFSLLLAVLGKFAWAPIASGLKAREDKIRQDIAEAEAARKRAEATLAQYNQQLAAAESQVREILTKGAADAERLATSLKMQAQQEAEEAKERATRDIESARKAALTDIYAQAAELSTNIAEKILRRSLNASDQRDLVEQSLEKFQTADAR